MFDVAADGIQLSESFNVDQNANAAKEKNGGNKGQYESNQYIATFSSEGDYRDATLSEEEERKRENDELLR